MRSYIKKSMSLSSGLARRPPPMPMVFGRSKSIFLHTPKCAGSSLSMTQFGYQIGHHSYRSYEKLLGKDISNYFVFTLIRDPAARFSSAYTFLERGGLNQDDAHYFESVIKPFGSQDKFLEALLAKKVQPNIHFVSMFDFLKDSNGNVSLDFVYKIEIDAERQLQSVDNDFVKKFICRGLQTKVNISSSTSMPDEQLIREYYDMDYRKFYI